jgi:hypothetical protein
VLLALFIGDVPLAGLARQSLNASGGSVPVWISAAFAVAGFVLAWRKPANPLGWLMLGGALFSAPAVRYRPGHLADAGLRIVTGLLVGGYAGLVLLATEVFGSRKPVAVAVSTLVAAALFNPVRRRVQRAVDRRFNRARYDADQTVPAFAARLKDAVDLDSVRDDLTSTVHRALEPEHLSVWVSYRG